MIRNKLRRYVRLLPYRLARNSILGLSIVVAMGFFTVQVLSRTQSDLSQVSTFKYRTGGSEATGGLVNSHEPGSPLPLVSAENMIVLDMNSGFVIYQKAADEEVAPASTTKMMTALVALDNYSLDQVVRVSRTYLLGQKPNLVSGEQITIEKLLYELLIQSANDAAEVLAENYPGGRLVFIKAMNEKAQELNLRHTNFVNPSGLDEEGHHSSAADLARLARVVMKNDLLRRIVAVEKAVISDEESETHLLQNTNELLGKVPGVMGIKTGFTQNAGEALVTYVEREHRPVMIVVIRSLDRFGDTQKIIDWVYEATELQTENQQPEHNR